jgi:hypothetical protein
MITLLGALLGFISSIFPDIFKLLKGSQDNKHELAVLQMQMQMAEKAGAQRLEEIGIEADVRASEALYKHARPSSGVKWVMALSDSVRPVITYCFFLSYIVVKISQYQMLAHVEALPWLTDAQKGQEWFRIILTLWNEEDQALFAAIMAFWFGDRSLSKRRAGR